MQKQGFIGGAIGAAILTVIMLLATGLGFMQILPFVGHYRTMLLTHSLDIIPATLLFILIGGIWGWFYGLLFSKPTINNGMLFGLAPTLWTWIIIPWMTGAAYFGGFSVKAILLPLFSNVIIWGAFLGWFMFNEYVKLHPKRFKQKNGK